jgi:hypothetical protein
MIEQLDAMETKIATGKITKDQAQSVSTMKSLLGMLTEGEHLLGAGIPDAVSVGTRDFSKLAKDPTVARRAGELYPAYYEQLWEARRELFRGDKLRSKLAAALEDEAQARALAQAQRETHGAPLELAPGAEARTHIDPKVDVPFGFYDRAGFDQFSHKLNEALHARAPGAQLVMEGSAVTGRRFERLVDMAPTGAPFGLGRTSDFDVAIVSDALFADAKRLGVPMSGGKVPPAATEPLRATDIGRLGLDGLNDAAGLAIKDATGLAYPVNFKIRPSSAAEAPVRLPLAQP